MSIDRARWTHVALPSKDLDETIAWYLEFTPLVEVEQFADDMGRSAWLSNDDPKDPFVLVLVAFNADHGKAQPQLAPFAHLGVELPSREAVDEYAAKAREAGCLAMEPVQMPAPVGYVAMVSDPDGNRIEYSFGQQVYAKVAERFGTTTGA